MGNFSIISLISLSTLTHTHPNFLCFPFFVKAISRRLYFYTFLCFLYCFIPPNFSLRFFIVEVLFFDITDLLEFIFQVSY